MASTVSEIQNLLVANAIGSIVAPITLFRNKMPDTPDAAYAVIQTGGAAPEWRMGSAVPMHERVNVQLRFRGAPDDSDGPFAVAEQAYKLLAQQIAVTLGATFYAKITPSQPPFLLERDGRGRIVWAFNAMCEKALSA